jgi:hypothetical protein
MGRSNSTRGVASGFLTPRMPEVRGYHASADLIHLRPGSSIADVETVGRYFATVRGDIRRASLSRRSLAIHNEDPASSSPALACRYSSA